MFSVLEKITLKTSSEKVLGSGEGCVQEQGEGGVQGPGIKRYKYIHHLLSIETLVGREKDKTWKKFFKGTVDVISCEPRFVCSIHNGN